MDKVKISVKLSTNLLVPPNTSKNNPVNSLVILLAKNYPLKFAELVASPPKAPKSATIKPSPLSSMFLRKFVT